MDAGLSKTDKKKSPVNSGGARPGKLNQTSDDNGDEKYTSQNYTEDYSSLQNKSGIDFNNVNKKFEL